MTRKTIDELEMLNPMELGKLLIAAVWKASPDVMYIQDLLDVGCPIEVSDKLGRNALYLASENGHLEVVEFLLSRGALVNARDDSGVTALHVAAHWGRFKVVRLLLSRGADINIRNNRGYTAWNLASDEIRKSIPELESK